MNLDKRLQEDFLAINGSIPVIPDLDVLQKYCDASLFSGLRDMQKIMNETEDPYTKINTFKNILATSKFISERVERYNATHNDSDRLINDLDLGDEGVDDGS